MDKKIPNRERMSIDVFPEEHRRIKVFAALHGESIREFVLECVRDRLERESENNQLSEMTARISDSMKEIWNNDKDAKYDEL